MTSTPLDIESISMGFLMMLETLTPIERAVFILHNAFDYSHGEIAAALGLTDPTVRQAFHRAKEHLAANRPSFAATREDHMRLLRTFMGALTTGDLPALQNLLAHDATLHADSGGKVRGAARVPLRGADTVARFLMGLVAKNPEFTALTAEVKDINGWPACVMSLFGHALVVVTIETDGHTINAVRNIVNPDKLTLRPMD